MEESTEKERYVVMKLLTAVDVTNPMTGKEEAVSIEGIDGFIPVFDDYADAEKASCEGKYSIMTIKGYLK